MSNRYLESGGTGIAPGSDMYYVGMVVSLQPLRGKRRQDLLDWCEWDWTVQWDENKKPVHYYHELQITPAYLKDLWQDSHWARFFELIEQDNFSELDPHFDATIATDDRPFLSCAA